MSHGDTLAPIAKTTVLGCLSEEGPHGHAEASEEEGRLALHLAQIGEKHPATKPLKGFGSAAVLEVIEDYQGDTYRAVYTVRLKRAVYVLHCFKKKSTKGTQTPRSVLDLMRSRLKAAQETDEEM